MINDGYIGIDGIYIDLCLWIRIIPSVALEPSWTKRRRERGRWFFFPCASYCALASSRRTGAAPTGRMRARYRRILSLSCPISIITNKNGVCSVSFGCDSRVLTYSRWIIVSADWNDYRTRSRRYTPIPVIPYNRIAYNTFCRLHHTHTRYVFLRFSLFFYFIKDCLRLFCCTRPTFPLRDQTVMTTTKTINNIFVV